MFDTLWQSFSLNLFEFNAIINDLIYLKFSFTLVNNCTKNKIDFLFVCLIQISLFSKLLSNSSSLHIGLFKSIIMHIWIFTVLFLHSNFFCFISLPYYCLYQDQQISAELLFPSNSGEGASQHSTKEMIFAFSIFKMYHLSEKYISFYY